MAVTTDIWRTFNSILNDCSDWVDAIRGASLRLLFPALDINHLSVDIGTSSTPVLGARPGSRRMLILDNVSDTDIYVSLDGQSATLTRGIRISSNGSLLLDITLTGQSISAVHGGTGTKRLLVTEDVQ
jgi:hypothetical protein